MNNSQQLRQQALDYINANPGCAGPDLANALHWGKTTTVTRLGRMVAMGDVVREEIVYLAATKSGFIQPQRSYAYWALRKTAAYTKRAAPVKPLKDVPVKTAKAKRNRKGVWVNNNHNRAPIPNQGGQGNIGQRVRCGSSLS